MLADEGREAGFHARAGQRCSPAGRGDDVAEPVDDPWGDRAEPALRDRLLAGEDEGAVTEGLPPRREHVVGGAGSGVDQPRAGVAADEVDAPHQDRRLVDVDLAVDRHHPVVAGHGEHGVRRQVLRDERGEPVDGGQLQPPRQRPGAVLVPERVEVGVVGVAELAAGRAQRGDRRRGEVAQRDDARGTCRRAARPG